MSALFNETGHDSIDQRNTEASRLIDELQSYTEQMNFKAQQFVLDMAERRDNNRLACTAKQLFWLRDLYQEFCC